MQQSRKRPGAIAEAFDRSPERIQHGDVKIGGGGVVTADQMLPSVDAASRPAGQNQGHLVGIM